MEEKEKEGRVYELGYLMVPSIEEKDLAAEVGNLKSQIDATGATTISEEYPKPITLAYEMTKVISNKNTYFTNGYFGWMKFECDPAQAVKLGEELKRHEKLIRFLLIKTVRENTMASKRPFNARQDSKRRPGKKDDEPKVEINKEEIDREIDALVGDEPVLEAVAVETPAI